MLWKIGMNYQPRYTRATAERAIATAEGNYPSYDMENRYEYSALLMYIIFSGIIFLQKLQ
jgi:hypothetical protein